MKKKVYGKYECSKHITDYRIMCEECSEKWANLQKYVDGTMFEINELNSI